MENRSDNRYNIEGNLLATTMIIEFVKPLGEAHVYVPESWIWISLIVNLYLVVFSSGTVDHPVIYLKKILPPWSEWICDIVISSNRKIQHSALFILILRCDSN